ncbi:putative NBD/HSP70 family sugar kinase [Actinomadura pelletieri DSM 43383]|uniref:Putative NBD/HSP70 family sugar kinase n=1 Tax=Actinomadura pelletieri DSM 43383 TaxID=1120940 RepID=A0A495QLJ2_9ACTN|nr:ROK family transcriptional regulator [Actinomadura pelletieri]RKS73434.1 putative NBD/HSP70 family sugar kinase [Actinomadura pelletieri DSM 43383]
MSVPVPGTPSLLRAINDRAALEALLDRGPLTRPQISDLTGISKPTASQLLARLEAAGLVVRDGIREGMPGRTAELYRINGAAAHVAGADVTPARIRVSVADLAGTVVGEYTLPTPERSRVDVVARMAAALDGAVAAAGPNGAAAGRGRAGLCRAVIGIQGAVDPATGRLGYASHIPGWHIPDLVATLSDGLGVRVAIENDVNLAALAERARGQAAGAGDFVLLWVADGVGMAVVLNGTLHRGATGGAGEIGYMPTVGAPLMRDVRRTHTGGVHSLTGGAAVLRLMREHGFRGRDAATALRRAAADIGAVPSSGTASGTGSGRASGTGSGRASGARTVSDVGARAERALTELATRLGVTLATVVAVLDPALVVLTGDVLLAGGEPLRARVEQHLHSLTIPRPRVRLSTVQGNPVLAGALQQALLETREEIFSSTVP